MFPDIANVIRIREALWRHRVLGSASIMVGSGLSRNADPLSSTARPMPTWSHLAEALCDPLYPTVDARRKRALREANGTSGFLRLAQEYQVAFGTSSLNDRIRNLVPDMDYRPGDLHKRLLRLPWADVFSTNWDTLLERACADVFDRSYDIVRTVGEIPFTTRPRIVKLHGSFPGHEPFIFTEEEYRTYPAAFSPFVNLVQQSMMETIFCLLGFSGDDPNFLHWSGWVRDNLGDRAPKIYLVGWLELSVHRRRMLEARNVMPVDLSALPGSDKWPPDLRHKYAAEWFIAALELGKPYAPTRWPSPPSPPPPPPSHLGAVPANTDPLPQQEPFNPPFDKPAEERDRAFRATIDAWAFNRRLYPGWLVAPEHVRATLFQTVRTWFSEFSRLSVLSAVDRLRALSELAWRTDHALFPFPSDQEEPAYAALSTIDHSVRAIGGASIEDAANWSDLLKGAETLALALARNARHSGNRDRFDRALSFLLPQRDYNGELRNAIAYEECLWDLATGDLTSVLARLEQWIPAEGETVWSLRKAGLLAEMEEHERACALLERTLVEIRRARRRDVDDLVSLSLESWALYLALAYSTHVLRHGPALPKDMPEPFERWRALAMVDCDAFGEYQALTRQLEADKPQQPEITITRGFDLDHTGITHHMGGGPSPTVLAAYQMVMLAELTGIPPSAHHMNLFGEGLKLAAKALATDEPWLASQIAVRIETSDKLIDDIFSRARIARLSERLVTMLRDTVLKRMAFGLTQVGARDDAPRAGLSMVGAALEVLSRVAVRLPADQLRALFEREIVHYRSQVFRRVSLFLGRPLSHLLERILESLPSADISDLLPQVFLLPLPHELGVPSYEYHWRDPITALPHWFDSVVQQPSVRLPVWDGIISHLLIAAKSPDAANRSAAVHRLFKLHEWGYLNDDEKKAFATALWAPAHLDGIGIPQHTDLRNWVLLLMPEVRPNQAKEALLNLVAERSRTTSGNVHKCLGEIGEILHQFIMRGISVDLPEDVKTSLVALISTWTGDRERIVHSFQRAMNRRDIEEQDALQGIVAILPYVTITDDLLEKIWTKAEAMDLESHGRVPAFGLYPELVRRRPDKALELVDRVRRALVSDREDAVREAVRGLYVMVAASQSSSELANIGLDDLVREIGIGIAARRLVLLRPALDFARWLFREGPEPFRQLIVRDCDHGLAALLEEASYSRLHQDFDVPSIRAACFRLASAMAAAGYSQERGVMGWLEQAEDDPLPEVRNAERQKL